MTDKKLCFKEYYHCIDDKMMTKTRRKMNKKSYRGRWYGGAEGDGSGMAGESVDPSGKIINELMSGVIPGEYTHQALASQRANIGLRRWNVDPRERGYEEEAESTANKIDVARSVFNQMANNPNFTRKDIIAAMMERAGVTESTAVSYYERIAKEAGMTNRERPTPPPPNAAMGGAAPGGGMGGAGDMTQQQAFQDMPPETDLENDLDKEIEHTFPDDPNRQGIIRVVDQAHLVYKRQTPDGTFEELWIYNVSKDMRDELTIRKKILAGTDIPPTRTRSADGSQTYTMTTLGNAQYVHITGLPN